MPERVYAAGAIDDFRGRLLDSLLALEREGSRPPFAVPVGLFLVLDEANGGGLVAGEIIRRFGFLDLETRRVVDLFLLGWTAGTDGKPGFDLAAFQSCREALRTAGVTAFGGYADLILVDAWLRRDTVDLDFEHAIHIDLADALAAKRISSIGGFLQGLIEATEQVRSGGPQSGNGAIERISDRLGLVVGTSSLLDYFLETWGRAIGAPKLRALATRRIGPVVSLGSL